MKFCMISKCGEGAGALYKIAQEGNDTVLHITEKDSKKIYEGILDSSNTIPNDADCYIFDCTGNGKIADKLKKSGKRIVAGSAFCDEIEEDRNSGIELMESIGVQLPQTEFFKDFQDAREFIIEHDSLFVFKPCGRGLPSKLTYKPYDSRDLLRYLNYVEKEFASEDLEFLLQEFVEGVAISTEGWFNGEKFIRPFDHTIENKKFMNDNLGPATGCEGDIVWACEENEIVKHLLKLEPILKSENYIGPIDINCIVSKKGIYGLEWTPRFGYDATPTLLRMFNDDIGKFFMEMEELPISKNFGGSLRVTIPPYPFEPIEGEPVPHSGGLPIDGIKNEEDYYFYEVSCGDEGLVHSGGVGLLLCTLGISDRYENALDDCYKLAEDLKVPDKQYRTDLQEKLNEDYKLYKETEIYA